MTPIKSIHTRAVLVSIHMGSWSAKIGDKAVTETAVNAYNAQKEAGNFRKNLLPATVTSTKVVERKKGKRTKSETVTVQTNSHKELLAHIAAVYVWVREQSLAWSESGNGWRMLPMSNYTAFMDGIRERKSTWERLLRVFLADYPDLIANSAPILGDMRNEDEYPSPSKIAARFDWDLQIKPVPESDFRVSLPAGEIEALTANAEARVRASIQDAQNDAVKRLFTCVSKIHAKLTSTRVSNRKADKGEKIGVTYRDTLIENARELCEVLTRLNVGDDAELEKFRRETELLATVEPETLRENADVAAETASRAQSILDAMTATYGANLFGGK